MKPALVEKFRAVYGRSPEICARAPGRIEFIGNHTDYNGGTVLGAAIDRGVWVALARREDAQWNFASGQKAGTVRIAAGNFAKQTGEAALARLLDLVVQGRSGVPPPDFPPTAPPPPA